MMRFKILVLVFLALMLVFSAYSVAYAQGLPTEARSTVIVGTYNLQGNYDYVATLKPNMVYNTTTLGPGQGVLFVAITKTINVTYTFSVSLSRPGSINLGISYLVTLSGGLWNKTLGEVSQTVVQGGTGASVVSRSFFLNVTQTTALAKEIGKELGYASPGYLIQIRPAITGSLAEAGRTVPLDFVSPLNLTLSNGVISFSGTHQNQAGNITSDVTVTYGSTYLYRYGSYGFFSGSLALLGFGTYYVRRIEKKEAPTTDDNLASITQPYREVIAATSTLPTGGTRIMMEKWEDLVKVADSMGKPILETLEKGDSFTYAAFWVLDGETVYIFEASSVPTWMNLPEKGVHFPRP